MDLSKEFFTVQSMLSMTGASGATFVITNALQTAFNFNPKWLGLIIAQAILIVGTIAIGQTGIADFMVAIINGFIVYLTAAGGTAATAAAVADTNSRRGVARHSGTGAPQFGRRRFTSPWF